MIHIFFERLLSNLSPLNLQAFEKYVSPTGMYLTLIIIAATVILFSLDQESKFLGPLVHKSIKLVKLYNQPLSCNYS